MNSDIEAYVEQSFSYFLFSVFYGVFMEFFLEFFYMFIICDWCD